MNQINDIDKKYNLTPPEYETQCKSQDFRYFFLDVVFDSKLTPEIEGLIIEVYHRCRDKDVKQKIIECILDRDSDIHHESRLKDLLT
jgi:hypothetical protein